MTVTVTTKSASTEPTYTPAKTGDTRVQGFYNTDASLKLELAGRYNSNAMSESGGSLEIVQYNSANGFTYAVSGVKGTLIAVDLNNSMNGDKAAGLDGKEYDIRSTVSSDSFTYGDFDSRRTALTVSGVLIQKGFEPSTDFEPEYIAVSGGKAYVSLQENNAIAVLDIAAKAFTGVYPLGFQNFGETMVDLENNGTAELKAYDGIYGIRMPDGISVVTIGGQDYLLTANEGASRADWLGMDNEFKDKSSPTGNKTLSKKVTWFNASMWDGLDQTKAYVFGGRSFSIYKITDSGLTLISDSGSDFEEITAEKLKDHFNCTYNDIAADDRSGKKGPEPETVITGMVNGKAYAFIALERTGGVMVYDITDPANISFVNYINSREFEAPIQGDVSPEGICFIPAANGRKSMVLTACEVYGTLAAYELTPAQDSSSDGDHTGGSGSGSSSSTGSKPSTSAPEQNESSVGFKDVPKNAYYFDAVEWAVKQQITSGTSAAEFDPGAPCTRAQIVTFLWRAAGSPESKTTGSFTDVPSGSYYEKAVSWAVEMGITTGVSSERFDPNAACTRAQIVTFLHRAAA